MAFYFKSWTVGRVVGGLTIAGAAVYTINHNIQSSRSKMSLTQTTTTAGAAPAAKTAFNKVGPAFLRLKLHSTEDLSPTTKRLRFELPSPDLISGLGLCCEHARSTAHDGQFILLTLKSSRRPHCRMAQGELPPRRSALHTRQPSW